MFSSSLLSCTAAAAATAAAAVVSFWTSAASVRAALTTACVSLTSSASSSRARLAAPAALSNVYDGSAVSAGTQARGGGEVSAGPGSEVWRALTCTSGCFDERDYGAGGEDHLPALADDDAVHKGPVARQVLQHHHAAVLAEHLHVLQDWARAHTHGGVIPC